MGLNTVLCKEKEKWQRIYQYFNENNPKLQWIQYFEDTKLKKKKTTPKHRSGGNQKRQEKQSLYLGVLHVNTNNRINNLGDSSAAQVLGCCCCCAPCSPYVCLPYGCLGTTTTVLVVFAVRSIHIPKTTKCPQMEMKNLTEP